MRWTAPTPHRLAAPARSAGVRLPENATVAHRACGAERLAAAAALVVQALIFVENFPFPWGLLLAAPPLVLPWTASAWRSPIAWGLLALADVVPLLTRPLFVPNHLFLMAYVALALCLAGTGEGRVRLMAANARWILAGVMARDVPPRDRTDRRPDPLLRAGLGADRIGARRAVRVRSEAQ